MKSSRWSVWLALLFLGCIVVPIGGYVAGGRVADAYAGSRGLASYLGTIYQDAAQGRPLALAILLGPLACGLVWRLRSALLRRVPGPT